MTCQRCHELMLVDYFIDLQDGGEGFWPEPIGEKGSQIP